MEIEFIWQFKNAFGKLEELEEFETRINDSLKVNLENRIKVKDVIFQKIDDRLLAIIKTINNG